MFAMTHPQVLCAMEAAVGAAKYSNTRVVVYSEIADAAQYLATHGVHDITVRHLSADFIAQLMHDTPLEAWYNEYIEHPVVGWHERRLHLSNAVRLAILYHKGMVVPSLGLLMIE